jgi:hypothetical protein
LCSSVVEHEQRQRQIAPRHVPALLARARQGGPAAGVAEGPEAAVERLGEQGVEVHWAQA